ncbi:RHS repeat-associated core domain-containing protein [Porphyromonas sp.]|uniref:RHS repeat domain-containing protein n=1 Tax=Porphyromonas sp. TaxID=1924944 RepID=UPI0025DC8629|nr:RHS repeat-associated core domain-containing protein [Porphyromonas sp.]
MSSPSTSHGYFESVSTQLFLSVGSSFEGVAGNSSANASQGISAGVSAVDTGMKAGMALAEARNEHAIVSFRYDNMGLPVEERSNEYVIKRTYDKSGQEYRLSDKAGNLFDDPDRKLRKYLRGGKLEQSGEWRFVYDRDGQLVEKYKGSGKWWDSKSERWRYIWNQNGTLKEVRPPGGGDFAFDALFTYDALGRRLSKDAIGITCWLWNGNVPLHEWTSSQRRNEQGEIEEYPKDLRTWLFEEESFVPLALFQDGKAYSIVTDHLGTPVEAYNEKGEEVWYRRLDMNGKVIEERSINYTSYKDYVKIPFLFQGQYYDEEIKLACNRFRYYDPQMGRYISEDPIRFASGTIALFSYVSDTNGCLDLLGLSYPPGRKGRQERLKSLLNDDKLPKHVKGWIRQEINAINRKHKK